jgi:hypothetical protein
MGLRLSLAAGIGDTTFPPRELEVLDELLGALGLPPHREPAGLTREVVRGATTHPDLREDGYASFPYSFLHYLRRLAVRQRLDPGWRIEAIDDPGDDPVYANFSLDYFDTLELEGLHLYAHSDADGYYLPLDFERVIADRRVTGRFVGSSARLRGELARLAPLLGFEAPRGAPGPAVIDAVYAVADAEGPLFRERLMWLALTELSRLSVELKTAIVFS